MRWSVAESRNSKHPVLLPRNDQFTALVVRDAHLRVCHNGVKETLTEVRGKYVKGRRFVRTVVHRCTTCRRHEGAPFKGPPPPPLPEFRIKEDPAFTYTGVHLSILTANISILLEEAGWYFCRPSPRALVCFSPIKTGHLSL